MLLMSRSLAVSGLTIWPLAIPMKQKFAHAAADRSISEPIVVAIELADGIIGYGETHPRPYVTGEDALSVIDAIRGIYLPLLCNLRPANFGEAIEAASRLPLYDDRGRVITAARAAVELALLDAYARSFGKSLESIAGWVSGTRLGPPGSRHTVRFSGVVSGGPPERAARAIRKMRLYRLRDFKLKVGDDLDEARLAASVKALGRGLLSGITTLRVDANGGWSLEEAIDQLERWESYPLACVEQPLGKNCIDDWAHLATRSNLPLMADESLVTPEDAAALIRHRAATFFNIRISKNGGLLPALRLAVLAREHNLEMQLGCMVGETSILSAAGRWFLQLVPDVCFAEGSYGRFLLEGDVVAKPLRFGFGGRWRPQQGPGLGVTIDPCALVRLTQSSPIHLPL